MSDSLKRAGVERQELCCRRGTVGVPTSGGRRRLAAFLWERGRCQKIENRNKYESDAACV